MDPDSLQTLMLLRNSRERLRERVKGEIIFAKPLLLFQERGIIYPNTINIIQGKTGVHKSRLVEAICATLLAREPGHSPNSIGFSRVEPAQRFRVLYVDTERNERDQFPFALQQIKRMAGFGMGDEVPEFDFFSLIQVPRLRRYQALELYLTLDLERVPGVETVVVLDVITDCVANFNNPDDSMLLLDFLNQQISHHNITFVCVIHENPAGGDKPRGHVGTELMNKSSSQVQIAFEQDSKRKETELIKVTTLKNRVMAKQPPVYMRFDADRHELVLAEEELIRQGEDDRRTKLSQGTLLSFLSVNLKEPIASGDLLSLVMDEFDCSRTTALARVKELLQEGNRQLISANVTGPRLEKQRRGRNEFYSIVIPN
ncbi:hypothetical protein [Nibribacter koreensis]